jgi:hypothetical protein
MSLGDQMKALLAKKQAANHPNVKGDNMDAKNTKTGRAPVVANKPQKKSTGRGR